MEYLKNRVTCRNWCETPISEEHLKYFEEILNLTPVKSSRIHWKIACITDKELKNKFFEKSKRSVVGSHVSTKNDFVFNPQLLAPVIYVWYSTNDDFLNHPYYKYSRENGVPDDRLLKEFNKDTIMGSTDQAFTLMYEAERLGYNTGFNCCYIEDPTEELLGIHGNHIVSLGIGYGKDPKRIFDNTEYVSIKRKDVTEYLKYFT